MSTDRDLTRIVRSWLHEDAHEDADRILNLVLDVIDTTPQRRAGWLARRSPPMNINFVRVALVAAAVVVIAVVGFQFLGNSNTGGPDGTETPQPTATQTATSEPPSIPDGSLPEGSHILLDRQTYGAQIIVTIAAPGWYGETGGGILTKNNNADAPDGAGLIVFARSNGILVGLGDVYVYRDPCKWATTKPDSPVTTVDEAVAALSSQASRDASTPVEVTLNGHVGKSITLHVPEDAVLSDCDRGEFRTLIEGEDAARSAQDPGQIDKLWVLDVSGELVIIDAAYYAGTPQVVLDEMDAIVESAGLTTVD